MDYLEDVVDRNGTTELVFRSGSTKAIQPGSWIVNCTGYLGLDNPPEYEPYVSTSGAVISLNPRSAVLHLPAFMGYYVTHLSFLDKLRDVPLYEVDWYELREKSNVVFPYALFALVQHNLSLIYDNVPGRVFSENGLDLDTWTHCRAACRARSNSCSRTVARASASVGFSTPCGNGSISVADRSCKPLRKN